MTTPAPIAVVIPTKNRPDLLREAVQSVRDQTLPPAEIIVVDDGSDPGHRAVLDELQAFATVIRNDTSRGGSAARNRGWRATSQPWIAFLDDDDLFDRRKIELQWAALQQAGARWSFTDYRMVNRRTMEPIDVIRPRDPTFESVLARSELSNCTLMVERTLLGEIGGYDESLPRNQDRDLFLRLLRTAPGVPVPEVGALTIVRWHVPDPRACIAGEDALHWKWREELDALPPGDRRRILSERRWLNWGNLARLDDRRAELREILRAIKIRPWVPKYWRSLALALLHSLGWSGRFGGQAPTHPGPRNPA